MSAGGGDPPNRAQINPEDTFPPRSPAANQRAAVAGSPTTIGPGGGGGGVFFCGFSGSIHPRPDDPSGDELGRGWRPLRTTRSGGGDSARRFRSDAATRTRPLPSVHNDPNGRGFDGQQGPRPTPDHRRQTATLAACSARDELVSSPRDACSSASRATPSKFLSVESPLSSKRSKGAPQTLARSQMRRSRRSWQARAWAHTRCWPIDEVLLAKVWRAAGAFGRFEVIGQCETGRS